MVTEPKLTLFDQIVPKIFTVSTHCEESQSIPQKITFFSAPHSSTVIARIPRISLYPASGKMEIEDHYDRESP